MIVPLLGLAAVALCGAPWVLLIARRATYALAIAVVVLLGFLGVIATMLATAAVEVPLLVGIAVVGSASLVTGVVLCVRDREQLRLGSDRRGWLLGLIGPILWFATVGLAQVLPGAAHLAWAMQGDAANNVLFARAIIGDDGIVVGPGANPVPLPAAVLALAMEFGRGSVLPAQLLHHDISAFAAGWTWLVGLSAAMAALATGVIARAAGAGRQVVFLTAGIGSVLPMSWYMTGYPAEYGFFNVHISLVLLFAVVVVFVESRDSAVALGLLAVGATSLLAVWSPLVVVPAALGVLVVLTRSRALIATRGPALLVVVAALAQLLVYGVVVVVPGLLANAEALSAPGGAYVFPVLMLPACGAVVVVLALAAVRTWRSPLLRAVVVVVLALGGGLAVLLFAAGWQWSYYPHKFAWLASCTLIVIGAGFALPSLVRLSRRRSLLVPATVLVVAGVLVFAVASPTVASGERRQHPFAWILSGSVMGEGDEVADEIFALADPGMPRILWDTTNRFQTTINFWLIQMQVQSISDEFDLRAIAYEVGSESTTSELCGDLRVLGIGVQVITESEALASELKEACPDAEAEVILTQAPGIH